MDEIKLRDNTYDPTGKVTKNDLKQKLQSVLEASKEHKDGDKLKFRPKTQFLTLWLDQGTALGC